MAFKLGKEVGGFLLDDPAIGHIDFYVGLTSRLHVDEERLRYVGKMIKAEKMRVETKNLEDEDYVASYDPEWNNFEYDSTSFYSKWNGSWDQRLRLRSLIVHEAVHAVVDLNRRQVFAMRGEAAGYLASAIFLHHHSAIRTILQSASGAFKNIIGTADYIAEKWGLYSTAGVHLTGSQILPLLRVLRNTPAYDHIGLLQRTISDGFDSPFK